MRLIKYKLEDLIELTTEVNDLGIYGTDDVRGMTITKEIIPTKANVTDADLDKYLVVHPQDFVYNPRTHGTHIGFGYNNTQESFIISWNNIAFRVKPQMREIVLPEYLFLYFNRSEWDREACYQSWGSSTEVFTWTALCEMVIILPLLSIQQKYVNVYEAMLKNQQSYEFGLEDLRLACDGYIEELRRNVGTEKICPYIRYRNDRNYDKAISRVMGLSTKKIFREAQSRVNREELGNYKIVSHRQFAFVPTTDTWKVLAFGLNENDEDIVVSPIYEVFSTDEEKLIPEYLAIWLSRTEFDRYARYHSWGSARENFNWEEMCNVEIPIPDVKIQQAIADIFTVYNTRRKINEQLKSQIKAICPILIKGSLEEGSHE